MNIKASDTRTKYQEKLWGVKMTEVEYNFYLMQNQSQRLGHCSSYIDKVEVE